MLNRFIGVFKRMIINKKQHEIALTKLKELMTQTDKLASDIEIYEKRTFDIDKPTALEAISFRMSQENLKQKDVIELFGTASKTSEVLNGKRELSKNMMRRINKRFDISFDVLMN